MSGTLKDLTYLAARPAVVLDCYKTQTAHWITGPEFERFGYGENGLFVEFIVLPLKGILMERC
jgi:hypothetical protein